MLIDERYRKCATFLYADLKDEDTLAILRKPVATTFFIASHQVNFGKEVFAVTARHVINRSRPHPLFIRINHTDKQFTDIPAPQDSWTLNPTTDVAVLQVKLPEESDV